MSDRIYTIASCSNEHYDAGIDVFVLELAPEEARRYVALIDRVTALAAEPGLSRISTLSLWDAAGYWCGVNDEACGDHGFPWPDDGWSVLPAPLTIDDEYRYDSDGYGPHALTPRPTECDEVRIWPGTGECDRGSIEFVAHAKHGDDTHTSGRLARDILERIAAGQPPFADGTTAAQEEQHAAESR